MSGYHDHDDLSYLAQLKESAPNEFAAWVTLDSQVGRKDGAIPHKQRELIAVACAHITQCVYCLDVHVKAAVDAGASREEIAEAALIAAALRAGGAGAHAALTMKLYEQHTAGAEQ
ncbi:carboxymuconolactone decarboxylase family protein [Janibacter terrae]|uniref:carboxymuconolactone decarboxylase family protein n=1 Tax=Janibacter terrae TaxID=103817 RepID=UPI00381B0528